MLHHVLPIFISHKTLRTLRLFNSPTGHLISVWFSYYSR
jgi:hypothetical protein